MADEEEVMEVQAGGEVSTTDALKEVLKKALCFDGVRRGLHESVKALVRGDGKLCILSKACENAEYKTLIQALCAEHEVPLIMADAGGEIGEWVGLAKLNADGTVRKAVRCSVAVVTDFGEESSHLTQVLEYVETL